MTIGLLQGLPYHMITAAFDSRTLANMRNDAIEGP